MANSNEKSFLYFAYGSNLFRPRLALQNPSAVFVSIGRLDNYKLEFDYGCSKTWMGAAATINPINDGSHVWGAVWLMSESNLSSLRNQEGVDEGIYEEIEVTVSKPDGEPLLCKSYRLIMVGSPDRRPSPQYLDVILRGAVQIGLPKDYVESLRAIEHNGYVGKVPVYDQLNLSDPI